MHFYAVLYSIISCIRSDAASDVISGVIVGGGGFRLNVHLTTSRYLSILTFAPYVIVLPECMDSISRPNYTPHFGDIGWTVQVGSKTGESKYCAHVPNRL